MANGSYKKLRKQKIKAQLKEQKIQKLTSELKEQMLSMGQEEWDKLAEDIISNISKEKEEASN